MNNSSSQNMFRIRNSEGHIFEIPESNLDAALARDERNEVVDDQEFSKLENINPQANNSGEEKVLVQDSMGIVEIPRSRLAEAEKRGGKLIDSTANPAAPQEESDSVGKSLARSAKSIVAGGVGGLVDTATSIYNLPASLQNATNEMMKKTNPDFIGENDFVPASQSQPLPIIPSASEAIKDYIDEATGGYTNTPKESESTQKGLETLSAIATPGGLAKAAVKGGLNATSKVLGALGTTKPQGLAGGAAAGYTTSEASQAGYGAPAAIGAGLVAGGATSLAVNAARSLDVKMALATLTGNSPKNIDLEAVRAAEGAGIDALNTVVNKSKSLGLAEQVVSKTPYFGSKYAKRIEASDKAFGDIIENSIAKVGKKIIDSDSPLDTGTMLKETMVDTKGSVQSESNNLYRTSSSQLPENAKKIPHNLLIAFKKVEKSIDTLKPSEAESYVLNYIKEIKSKLFSKEAVPETKLALSHDLEFKYVPNDISGKISHVPIPVKKLIGSKVSLNDIIDWDINTPAGAKQKLKLIQGAYLEDIAAYGKDNPKWYSSFNEAENYYGKYLGDEGLGNKVLRKQIFAQDNPEKIIGNLRNISDFKYLGNVLDRNEVSQNFFNSIKREKLADLIMGKVIDPKTGSVSYLGFSKAMETNSNKELIRYLAGDNYNELVNLNKYAKAVIRKNQRNPNPSGTAPTKVIYGAFGSAVTGAIAGGIAGGVTAGVAPLAGVAALGTGMSWLVNNKKALQWGIEGAKKIANGNVKDGNIYFNRIERTMKQDLGEDFVKQFIAGL